MSARKAVRKLRSDRETERLERRVNSVLCTIARFRGCDRGIDVQSTGCDPKGHELYLALMKPFEKKVEVIIGADVQIARGSWVQRRKTNRVAK